MAFPVLSIVADAGQAALLDPLKANVLSPIKGAASSLFGLKQDPRFAQAGVAADIEAFGAVSTEGVAGSFSAARVGARRPLRGIQIKEDTYVSLRIITNAGIPIFQLNSAGTDDPDRDQLGRSFVNTNFIAQTIVEERVEKSQILETFGEPFVFFFGERPRFVNVSGYLLNTVDFNWRSEWWDNYENKLRGTKLVEQKAKVFMTWDDIVVVGYIMSATANDIATEPYRIPFQFSLFLTNYFNIGIRGKVPVGHTSPIQKLRAEALAGENRGPNALFSKIFQGDNPIATTVAKVGGIVSRAVSPVRNALTIVQGVAANPSKIFDAPGDLEALSLLRGGARPPVQFGPLRNNFDEFLNTELDALDIGTPSFSGLTEKGFLQRLISFVPGLNDSIELTKTIKKLQRNGIATKSTTGTSKVRGNVGFTSAFKKKNFGDNENIPFFRTPVD